MIFLPARVREVLDSSGYSHRYAVSDYELNEQEPLSEEDLARIKSYFDEHDFEVNILRH